MSDHGGVPRGLSGLEHGIRWVTVTLLALLCINVFVQVIFRYVAGYASRWTLEISRYTMIWIVALACGPALRQAFLVGVDFFKDRMAPRTQVWVACLGRAFMGVFSVVIILQAFKLMQSQWEMDQASPALEVSMALITLGLPVGFSVFLVYLAVLTYADLAGLRGRK
ncbi:MAG: TRAP transporter small permease [Candidatus Methylomirabilales bacterium]